MPLEVAWVFQDQVGVRPEGVIPFRSLRERLSQAALSGFLEKDLTQKEGLCLLREYLREVTEGEHKHSQCQHEAESSRTPLGLIASCRQVLGVGLRWALEGKPQLLHMHTAPLPSGYPRDSVGGRCAVAFTPLGCSKVQAPPEPQLPRERSALQPWSGRLGPPGEDVLRPASSLMQMLLDRSRVSVVQKGDESRSRGQAGFLRGGSVEGGRLHGCRRTVRGLKEDRLDAETEK